MINCRTISISEVNFGEIRAVWAWCMYARQARKWSQLLHHPNSCIIVFEQILWRGGKSCCMLTKPSLSFLFSFSASLPSAFEKTKLQVKTSCSSDDSFEANECLNSFYTWRWAVLIYVCWIERAKSKTVLFFPLKTTTFRTRLLCNGVEQWVYRVRRIQPLSYGNLDWEKSSFPASALDVAPLLRTSSKHWVITYL